jgi:hypothetical protein
MTDYTVLTIYSNGDSIVPRIDSWIKTVKIRDLMKTYWLYRFGYFNPIPSNKCSIEFIFKQFHDSFDTCDLNTFLIKMDWSMDSIEKSIMMNPNALEYLTN